MARIIQIGKRRWLAGMTWSSFEDIPSKAEVREDAERLSSSWACVRVGESAIQAGFSKPVGDTKKTGTLYSLAAMLADSHEQPWLGTFKISDGLWWYIAVRDGHAILPDGDVIGGEAEIFAARDRHSGYTDWKYIEGDFDLLTDIVSGIDAKKTRVRALTNGLPGFTPWVLLLTATALFGGAVYWWWKDQKDQEQKQLLEAARAQANALLLRRPVAPPPSPLLTLPRPNNFLTACHDAIYTLPLSQYGWALESVSCVESNAKVRWRRDGGATVALRPDGILDPTGESIDQVISLVGLIAPGSIEAIDLADEDRKLRAWAQSVAFGLVLGEQPKPAQLPGAAASSDSGRVGGPGPISQKTVKLTVRISPFGLDLSSIPGLRLTKVEWLDNGWLLEGMLYGR